MQKTKFLLLSFLAIIFIFPLVDCGKKALNEENYANILVTKVFDGDTVELAGKYKVRLIGIDTPECWFGPKLERDARRTGKSHQIIMAMGKRAKDAAQDLAGGKRVRLEFDIEKKDKYDRILAYVFLPDGRMMNAELLKMGYAKVYIFSPNVKYAKEFRKLEKEAKSKGKGFWR